MGKIYANYGINWMSYLEVEEVDEDVVRLVREFRRHKFNDDNHPKEIHGEFKLSDKGTGRIVSGVELNGRFYLVENPMSVWELCGR
jgi:hypothetical protein